MMLEDYFVRDRLNEDLDKEVVFHIQNAVRESSKFNKYLCKQINIHNDIFTLICSPIPNVCEDCPADGIIFTVYKGVEICSQDSAEVLLIFGRILSNWVSKYNDCVRREKMTNPNILSSLSKVN
jgi:hypothetical protein